MIRRQIPTKASNEQGVFFKKNVRKRIPKGTVQRRL